MFDKSAFDKRERAMEDEFFHRVDEKLREELRQSMERDKSRESLAKATGLSDNDVLDALIDAGFQVTTLAALSLVPAIFVAWADDKVDEPEREQLEKAATDHGIAKAGLAWQLLESWMEQKPPKSLWNTWQQYAEAVGKSLTPTAAGILADEIYKLSKVIAEASGGLLGIGKISSKERAVLDQIKAALAH